MGWSCSRSNSRAFSLLEIIVAIAVIGVLVGISIPLYRNFIQRAHKAACISHLRTLHSAFATAIQDQGHWPQIPLGEGEWNESRYFQWWVDEMEQYGIAEDVWRCPADKKAIELSKRFDDSPEDFYTGSYVPSRFDDNSNSPFRYNQPWLVERSPNHNGRAHILMPDGSVSEHTNPFAGR